MERAMTTQRLGQSTAAGMMRAATQTLVHQGQ